MNDAGSRHHGWAGKHAALMLGSGVLSVWVDSAWPFPVVATASMLVFLARGRAVLSRGGFGAANWVTASRLVLVLVLSASSEHVPPAVSCGFILVILLLDRVDGVVARRSGRESGFGARFDTETDALLIFGACLALHLSGRLGAWVLLPGALRYLYVLALVLRPSQQGDEPRSLFARSVFVVLGGCLAGAFIIPGEGGATIAALGSGLAVWSFSRSFWWSYGRRLGPGAE